MIMNGEWVSYPKEAVVAQINVLSRYLPGETSENHEHSQDSRYPIRYSNRVPPEYKSTATPTCSVHECDR
jgi:hypothetical protein